MLPPKRLDRFVREDQYHTEDATVVSVRQFKGDGNKWKGSLLSTEHEQPISSDPAEYPPHVFHPETWVYFEEAKVYGPKGWVYCPNRGVIVPGDKVSITDVHEPILKESKADWVRRVESDTNLKSLMAWSGWNALLTEVWVHWKGEEKEPVKK